MSSSRRVIVIGLDAAEKDLVVRWSDEGVLPTIRRLREEGTWAITETPPRVYNGAVWPSIYTGRYPGRHQRFFYNRLDGYEIKGLRRLETKGEAFWEVLNRAEKRVAVIDVPFAPWTENLNGIQVADWFVHDRSFPAAGERSTDLGDPVVDDRAYRPPKVRTYPAGLKDDVLRFGRSKEVPRCELSGRTPAAFRRFRHRLIERIENKTRFCVHKLKQEPWDLFFAVYCEAHDVGHECWHIHDAGHPKHDPEVARTVGDPIRDVYVAIDGAIARLLDEAGPEALIYVVCSHGMGPVSDGNAMLDDILSRFDDTAPPICLNVVSTLNRAWSRTPGPLRMALNPIRNRVRKTVHEALVGPTRGRRSCFAIPTNSDLGGVRVNLVGREPNGRVRAGEEFGRFCANLTALLFELVDADSGEPAVRRVATYDDIYPREPMTEDLYNGRFLGDRADLLIEWNKLSLNAVASPRIGRLEPSSQNSRKGDHKDGGLVIAYGRDIGSGAIDELVPVTDLAPTFSSVLGVSLPDADGRSRGPLMPG